MVEIPDTLHSLFTAQIEEQDGRYVIDVPSGELEHDAVKSNGTYRIAILESSSSTGSASTQQTHSQQTEDREPSGPPVDEGDVRDVTVEHLGDQGDGIAKVERGYVVIVPNAQPGDEPTVKIEDVRENVSFAEIVDSDPRSL